MSFSSRPKMDICLIKEIQGDFSSSIGTGFDGVLRIFGFLGVSSSPSSSSSSSSSSSTSGAIQETVFPAPNSDNFSCSWLAIKEFDLPSKKSAICSASNCSPVCCTAFNTRLTSSSALNVGVGCIQLSQKPQFSAICSPK